MWEIIMLTNIITSLILFFIGFSVMCIKKLKEKTKEEKVIKNNSDSLINDEKKNKDKINEYINEPLFTKTYMNKVKWVINNPEKAAKRIIDDSKRITELTDELENEKNDTDYYQHLYDKVSDMEIFYKKQCDIASKYAIKLRDVLCRIDLNENDRKEVMELVQNLEGVKGYYE